MMSLVKRLKKERGYFTFLLIVDPSAVTLVVGK
jgi:hypothetical protein